MTMLITLWVEWQKFSFNLFHDDSFAHKMLVNSKLINKRIVGDDKSIPKAAWKFNLTNYIFTNRFDFYWKSLAKFFSLMSILLRQLAAMNFKQAEYRSDSLDCLNLKAIGAWRWDLDIGKLKLCSMRNIIYCFGT